MKTPLSFRLPSLLCLLALVAALGTLEATARTGDPAAKPQRGLFSGLFKRGARSKPETGEPRETGRSRSLPEPQARQRNGQAKRGNGGNNIQGGGARINRFALSRSDLSTNRVVVDVSKQRAYLLVGGSVAVETPISTARPGKRTPRGRFAITERVRSNKISTIYGVAMPYWMRLNNTVFGLHAGHLPGYPASAGCVRLHPNAAPVIFDHTRRGTRVDIYSSWSGL